MTVRWVVDVDGRGLYSVAEEQAGRCVRVGEPATREKCERRIAKLRERDVERTHRARVENGRKLAARQREATE